MNKLSKFYLRTWNRMFGGVFMKILKLNINLQ